MLFKESDTVYVTVYVPASEVSTLETMAPAEFLMTAVIFAVTSPSVTSNAVTPAKGLKLLPTRIVTSFAPETTGPVVSRSGVDSTISKLSKYITALTALPLTVPSPNKIPPLGLSRFIVNLYE